MKVKFLDVIQMGTHLYKSGETGEFSDQTAEELIKKGLAVLDDGNESAENTAGPQAQETKGGKGAKGGKGKNSTPPKDENGAGGNENNGSDDETKSDENAQTTNEDSKPE
ncbi:hypothetical protein [Acinetobacter baumannii]|uniref:Uncharacterized protein n=1 Tax=Acinetobacter baumannii TaxID=470 RepID=A0A7X1SFT7_ACIBA|nr:hypothetical protein [Acinetobacter baumannii]ALJ86736.1 hypothetical protein AN415_00816 [Acinetobacter baumannii]EGJ61647.1 hypothetical protein HMPREF0021_00690 [Acinetobacter baumannii 6013150]EGJ63370.1 hypothetical protein HMPREF0020_03023 [Acinetobacter baumannii 6013113]EHU1797814.1 hypothetical protein [Acinetobacter baumannii]EHU2743597.1 hypothetical protein [Acinetobacter baumannii]